MSDSVTDSFPVTFAPNPNRRHSRGIRGKALGIAKDEQLDFEATRASAESERCAKRAMKAREARQLDLARERRYRERGLRIKPPQKGRGEGPVHKQRHPADESTKAAFANKARVRARTGNLPNAISRFFRDEGISVLPIAEGGTRKVHAEKVPTEKPSEDELKDHRARDIMAVFFKKHRLPDMTSAEFSALPHIGVDTNLRMRLICALIKNDVESARSIRTRLIRGGVEQNPGPRHARPPPRGARKGGLTKAALMDAVAQLQGARDAHKVRTARRDKRRAKAVADDDAAPSISSETVSSAGGPVSDAEWASFAARVRGAPLKAMVPAIAPLGAGLGGDTPPGTPHVPPVPAGGRGPSIMVPVETCPKVAPPPVTAAPSAKDDAGVVKPKQPSVDIAVMTEAPKIHKALEPLLPVVNPLLMGPMSTPDVDPAAPTFTEKVADVVRSSRIASEAKAAAEAPNNYMPPGGVPYLQAKVVDDLSTYCRAGRLRSLNTASPGDVELGLENGAAYKGTHAMLYTYAKKTKLTAPWCVPRERTVVETPVRSWAITAYTVSGMSVQCGGDLIYPDSRTISMRNTPLLAANPETHQCLQWTSAGPDAAAENRFKQFIKWSTWLCVVFFAMMVLSLVVLAIAAVYSAVSGISTQAIAASSAAAVALASAAALSFCSRVIATWALWKWHLSKADPERLWEQPYTVHYVNMIAFADMVVRRPKAGYSELLEYANRLTSVHWLASRPDTVVSTCLAASDYLARQRESVLAIRPEEGGL